MRLNFKIIPSPARLGEAVQLTAIDIIHGGFGRHEGSVVLVASDGAEEPLRIDHWLPFGVEATLPPVAPGPGPYVVRVQTAAPLDEQGETGLELTEPAAR
ncbi:MAG: hypothetical protein ACRDKW_03005 [Actinomycetota bacterium]